MSRALLKVGGRKQDPGQRASAGVAPSSPLRRRGWALDVLGAGAILAICYYAEKVMVVILISVILAFILAPLADFLVRLRMPRALAAGISVSLLVAFVGGVIYFGVNQTVSLVDQLPQFSAKVRGDLSQWVERIEKVESMGGSPQEADAIKVRNTTNLADVLSRGFGSATETILAISFMPFLVFFMLTWQEHARASTVQLFPCQSQQAAHVTIGLIAKMIRSFIIGDFLIGLIMAAVSSVVFGFLHIPFFYFAGIGSGFLSLVPYLGVLLALLPPLFLGVGHLSVAGVIWIVATVFILHVVSMNVFYPKLLGRRLRLNPLALTMALLVWAWLWGAVGMLLAIPITAGMKIVFDHVESLRPCGGWLGEDCVNRVCPR